MASHHFRQLVDLDDTVDIIDGDGYDHEHEVPAESTIRGTIDCSNNYGIVVKLVLCETGADIAETVTDDGGNYSFRVHYPSVGVGDSSQCYYIQYDTKNNLFTDPQGVTIKIHLSAGELVVDVNAEVSTDAMKFISQKPSGQPSLSPSEPRKPNLSREEKSEDDDSGRPWQGFINLMFVAGAILIANLLCCTGSLICDGCRREDGSRAHLADIIVLFVFVIIFVGLVVWLGTLVNWHDDSE